MNHFPTRLGDVVAMHQADERARTFSKWIFACGAAQRGQSSATQLFQRERGSERITKAVNAAMLTGDVGDLLHESRAWVGLLNQRTVLGRLTGAIAAPPHMPVAGPADDPEAQWLLEGYPIPTARMSMTDQRTSIAKFAFILAFSKDLFKFADERALSLIERRSLRAAGKAEDALFLSDTAAVPNGSAAGILNGVVATGGGSPSSLEDDLEQLWTSVSFGNPDSPYFIVSPRAAVYLASLHRDGTPVFPDLGPLGGAILGVPTITSPSAANHLILIDAANLVVTDEGLEVQASEEAAVELLDNPTNNSATGTATALVSSFQTNSRFLRFVRYIHWMLLNDSSVGFVELPIAGSPS